MSVLRRAFIDAPHGQVHVWRGGEGPPLVMLHASPGSARQLLPLARMFAHGRGVLAVDTPGNGDSDPLPGADPAVEDYADALADWLPVAVAGPVDVYGSHTGANIALALANRHPGLVRRLVLDGLGYYTDAERAALLANYAPDVPVDPHGAHLLWAFHFCRDQYLFFPWNRRDADHRRPGGLPDPQAIHDWALEVLKALPTYGRAYRAAFRFDKLAAIARLRHKALFIALADDPMAAHVTRFAGVAADASSMIASDVGQMVALGEAFLATGD